MAVRRWIVTACLAAACLAVAPAVAHHASTPFYDGTRSVEAVGVVTRFEFKNPHSFLYLEGVGKSFYDGTRSVEAVGVVTRFEFKNPHSFLYLEGGTMAPRSPGRSRWAPRSR